MKNNILVIGSTGNLGRMLLKYCHKNNIKVDAITSYKNQSLQKKQQFFYDIKNGFCLNNSNEQLNFKKLLLKKKFKIIYFLDYGSYSLTYIDLILKNNTSSYVCIANKEMIIAGGSYLIKKIKKTGNFLIPLDSEHFSLTKSNISNKNIDKIFITASGGPFYFKKNINLNNVGLNQVLNHPKWKMGYNNSIDSSNFINKILEILELSIIFDIEINKIDFLITKEAYIHSLIIYNNSIISFNCFDNNMLIPLSSPLIEIFNSKKIKINHHKNFEISNFKLELMNDKRFKIMRYVNRIKSFTNLEKIYFLILNNKAQSMYLNNLVNYNNILPYIMKNMPKKKDLLYKIKSFESVISKISKIKKQYEII